MRTIAKVLVVSLALVAGCCRDGRAQNVATAGRGFAEASRVALSQRDAVAGVADLSSPDLAKGAPAPRAVDSPRADLKARRAVAAEDRGPSRLPPPRRAQPTPPPAPVVVPPPEVPGPTEVDASEAWEAPAAAPALAPPPPARRVAVSRRTPASAAADSADAIDWRPSTPVAIAGGVGAAGLVMGALGAGIGDGPPNVGFTVASAGIGLIGLTTAGILMLLETDDPEPVRVGVGPGSVMVGGGF